MWILQGAVFVCPLSHVHMCMHFLSSSLLCTKAFSALYFSPCYGNRILLISTTLAAWCLPHPASFFQYLGIMHTRAF